MLTSNEALDTLRREVADVLCLELDEVRAESNFFTDLDGESIDLLELSFKLDKLSGVKIGIQRIGAPDELDIDANGKLTDATMKKIRDDRPELDYSVLEANPTRDGLIGLVTIANLARVYHRAIFEAGATPQPRAIV